MLGVVLWSDNSDNKAVIWCEDHGDLAYFNGGADVPFEAGDFDAGDLVHFELQQEKHLRFAHNPRRIEQGAYQGLSEQLQDATGSGRPNEVPIRARQPVATATVIPFMAKPIERAEPELVAV